MNFVLLRARLKMMYHQQTPQRACGSKSNEEQPALPTAPHDGAEDGTASTAVNKTLISEEEIKLLDCFGVDTGACKPKEVELNGTLPIGYNRWNKLLKSE